MIKEKKSIIEELECTKDKANTLEQTLRHSFLQGYTWYAVVKAGNFGPKEVLFRHFRVLGTPLYTCYPIIDTFTARALYRNHREKS